MFSSNTSSAAGDANFVEDVFSTYLYTGNGSTQTITNGIDLAGKGGLVWIKERSGSQDHTIFDTARGVNNYLRSNSSGAQNPGGTYTDLLTAFNATGFSLGADASTAGFVNGSGSTYASWTFREQPKFFDVVTYTGTGANRTIAHNLGSVPGCIIVKRTDTTADWQVYHGSLANTQYLVLNDTAAAATGATRWNSTTPTSSVFSLGTDASVNASGDTYVAYLFAHDSGGFGLTGTDNVISCGSVTSDSNRDVVVDLGFEPQWVLFKRTNSVGAWNMTDSMRGLLAAVTGADQPAARTLASNTSDAENNNEAMGIYATGFREGRLGTAGDTYIYIAIRRGPMKVPTDGTKVFGLNARTGTGANATVTGSAGVSDAVLIKNRGAAVASLFSSRLTGTGYLVTSTTAAEVAAGTTILQANPWDVMDGVKVGTTSTITNASANTYINYLFDRAPGFFDEVSFEVAGTISDSSESHNLGVTPELMIFKPRVQVKEWVVWHKDFGTSSWILLHSSNAAVNSGPGTMPVNTATTFGVNSTGFGFTSFLQCMAYLFATCPGVSKVFSYTGNGTSQTINCGFTGGSRFILIKRTDSTGDWYVWDTARGIVSGNDPHLSLNTTAAEVTTDDSVDADSTGFIVNQVAATNINVSSATYIGLAIA